MLRASSCVKLAQCLIDWGETVSDILVESDRLLLKRVEVDDQQSLERIFCNRAMMHYLGGVWTPRKVAEALQEWHDDWGCHNRWYGTLLRRQSMEVIGTAGLTENTIVDETGLELSWFVLPEHQRQGFATEITVELLRFAFEGLGAERVVAETHPENRASNKVLEKLCFECLGERQHHYDYLPGFDLQVLWALTRVRWHRGLFDPRRDV